MRKTIAVLIVTLFAECSQKVPADERAESDFVRLVKPTISDYERHQMSGYFSTADANEAVFGIHVWTSDSTKFLVKVRYVWENDSKVWKYDKWTREPSVAR